MKAGTNFACHVLDTGPLPCVSFSGELDLGAAEVAWADLEPLLPDAEGLVIDLSDVTFIDSRGLSVLLRAWTALGSDRVVTLRNPTPRIRRTLEVAGVAHAFAID